MGGIEVRQQPKLVTLYGEENVRKLARHYNVEPADIIHYSELHPELLGAWITIIKGIGKAVAGIGSGIAKGVRAKRARKAKAKAKAAKKRQQLLMQQRQFEFQRLEKQKKQKQMLMMALPLIGMAFFMGD